MILAITIPMQIKVNTTVPHGLLKHINFSSIPPFVPNPFDRRRCKPNSWPIARKCGQRTTERKIPSRRRKFAISVNACTNNLIAASSSLKYDMSLAIQIDIIIRPKTFITNHQWTYIPFTIVDCTSIKLIIPNHTPFFPFRQPRKILGFSYRRPRKKDSSKTQQ